jgi:hypothetical protein
MKRIDDFRQRQPGDGVPASHKTSAWIGFDDQNFYAIFVCESPAGQTRARMAKREDIMSDDIVGIFFDTYHSGQRGYEFFVNPLGVQADAALSDSQGDDFSFDTLWYSEGKLTPEGYVAMMTIPFRSLRFASQAVQTWGFGLYRGIPANNENSFWPFVTEKISGFVPQLAKMTGLENISPGRNLQLIPYAAFSRSHFLDQPDSGVPAFRGKTDFRPGLDAKAVIHDTLALDVALNPDFSQVESDDPQVTVNQRFEVVFPEKRPFFLENNGYFSTPENLFFSRRIVDPEFGGRITGKLGRWNLGVLAIDDRAPGSGLDPDDPNSGARVCRQLQSRRRSRHADQTYRHMDIRRTGDDQPDARPRWHSQRRSGIQRRPVSPEPELALRHQLYRPFRGLPYRAGIRSPRQHAPGTAVLHAPVPSQEQTRAGLRTEYQLLGEPGPQWRPAGLARQSGIQPAIAAQHVHGRLVHRNLRAVPVHQLPPP